MSKPQFDTLEELEAYVAERRKQLKPTKNLRDVRPHVCATCKFYHAMFNFTFCERENGFCHDETDLQQWTMTCDGWTENK